MSRSLPPQIHFTSAQLRMVSSHLGEEIKRKMFQPCFCLSPPSEHNLYFVQKRLMSQSRLPQIQFRSGWCVHAWRKKNIKCSNHVSVHLPLVNTAFVFKSIWCDSHRLLKFSSFQFSLGWCLHAWRKHTKCCPPCLADILPVLLVALIHSFKVCECGHFS